MKNREYLALKKKAKELKEMSEQEYDNYDDVLEKAEEMDLDLKPTQKEYIIIEDFKNKSETLYTGLDRIMSINGYWIKIISECRTVTDCIRLYNLVLSEEINRINDIFEKGIVNLANGGYWK